ncbi:MAG: hypothetical protein ABIP75_14030 [Pyrinomonadaceae bacterium]
MRNILFCCVLVFACAIAVTAQEKGVDSQSDKIRETGTSTNSGGNRTNTGVGRGVSFGKGRTETRSLLPNPFRFTGRLDIIVKAVQDVMTERKMIPDDATSRTAEGLVISQPFTFSKGAVVSRGELSRYSDIPETSSGTWSGGRYTFTIQVAPVDGIHANVSISAKIEGRTNGILGTEWTTLASNGLAEDEFLTELIGKLTGEIPAGIVVP